MKEVKWKSRLFMYYEARTSSSPEASPATIYTSGFLAGADERNLLGAVGIEIRFLGMSLAPERPAASGREATTPRCLCITVYDLGNRPL